MATLRTDYKDDIYQGNRKYIQTKNEDGTVSFSDATQYEQEGDYFGANEINIISQAVNEAQDKADQAFQSASDGKTAIKNAITGVDPTVPIPTDATFAQLAAAIGQIETGIDTSDATATAEYLLANLTMYVNNLKVIGTMVNNGAVNQSLPINGTYIIPKGYHNGSGKVTQSLTTKAAQTYTPGTANQTIAAGQYLSDIQTILGDPDLIPANILNTANIFGVQGAAIAGKRFASGSVFCGLTQYVFYSRAGGGNSWYGLTVSGLTFKPSIIVCMFRDTRNDGTSYAGDSYTIYSPITGYVLMFTAYDNSGQTSVTSYQVNVGDCYVNASGFRLPALPNVTYNWMAWE